MGEARKDVPQNAAGSWCPVLLNLRRSALAVLGEHEQIRTVSLDPARFPLIAEAGRCGAQSGEMLKRMLCS